MLEHIFLIASDLPRSIAFYEAVLPVLGITVRHDYDGKNGPPDHPHLKGFRANDRIFFFLAAPGNPAPGAVHVGVVGCLASASMRQIGPGAV